MNEIRFSILKTMVRGSSETPSYNILMEENDVTIIFYPLAENDEEFDSKYKTVFDVLSEIENIDESMGYFNESDGFTNPDDFLVGFMNGSLSLEDLPEHIELVGFEGLK